MAISFTVTRKEMRHTIHEFIPFVSRHFGGKMLCRTHMTQHQSYNQELDLHKHCKSYHPLTLMNFHFSDASSLKHWLQAGHQI